MHLITGLGNPGQDYTHTRHNIGFRLIDALQARYEIPMIGKKMKSILYKGQINGHDVLLQKPETYMNLSGEAVQAVMQFYKLTPADLLVITDDIDIAFAQLRLREKGSAGTHNGMKSIITHLGTPAFKRLRIGVGPKPPRMKLSDYVLSNFTKEESAKIPDVLVRASNGVFELVTQPLDRAMKLLNTEPKVQEKASVKKKAPDVKAKP